MGAIELLRRDLDLARPAGVRMLFEIRERPMPPEVLMPEDRQVRLRADGHWQEDAMPGDRLARVAVQATLPRESHAVGEGRPVWSGRFDGTTFDASRLM